VITLTLLHPIQSIPVQSWSFEHEPVVRIGRSTDNHVILYSAVVSRHHVELRQSGSQWEIVNLGANGTYLDGKRITQVPVVDGVIIRLARSGPNIQIHLGAAAKDASDIAGDRTMAQRIAVQPGHPSISKDATVPSSEPKSQTPSMPATQQPEAPDTTGELGIGKSEPISQSSSAGESDRAFSVAAREGAISPVANPDRIEPLFCQQSGEPLQVLQTVVEYKIVKTLQADGVATTQVAWRNGQSLLLRSLNPEWVNHPKALELFEQEATILQQLNHPSISRFVDYFQIQGQPYLAMEWVHGKDLQQWVLEKGAFSLEAAIGVLLQVCDALDYLHQQNPPYIHQDIRPENLVWRSSTLASHTIAVVGFPSFKLLETGVEPAFAVYKAPEQQQGQPTPASDLYALGPTLIYLLAGKDPSEFYTQREQGHRLYPEYVPGLPANLVPVLRKLTNPLPEDRFTSAAEVAEVLSQLEVEAS
jgi:serine/threonine-protein kinase